MTKHVHGACACDVKFYSWLIVWGGVVCLWCVLGGVHLENKNIYFLPCTHARDTGGPGAFACNLAIFFSKLVTCTHYGATYWDTLYSKRCREGVSLH